MGCEEMFLRLLVPLRLLAGGDQPLRADLCGGRHSALNHPAGGCQQEMVGQK